MTIHTPEWYRRQADKMLEAAEAAERLEALAARGDDLPHGTVIRFNKVYTGVGECVYAAVKVHRTDGTGSGNGWYRTGRGTRLSEPLVLYTWRALLEWIGVPYLDTIEVMEPARRLTGEETSA